MATRPVYADAEAVTSQAITANTVWPGTIYSTSLERAFRKAAGKLGFAEDVPWADMKRKCCRRSKGGSGLF